MKKSWVFFGVVGTNLGGGQGALSSCSLRTRGPLHDEATSAQRRRF